MPRGSLQDFYTASASVAGALIGLLFVAITVAHSRLTAKDAAPAHRIRAAAAMTAFTNALTVSLFTLIEGQRTGGPVVVVAVLGLCFVGGSLLSLRGERRELREVFFLLTLAGAFIAQLVCGLLVAAGPDTLGQQRDVAILVVVFFLIGIARSWELIDGPSIGLGRELGSLLRSEVADLETPAPTAPTRGQTP
jgi:hypothetical protein